MLLRCLPAPCCMNGTSRSLRASRPHATVARHIMRHHVSARRCHAGRTVGRVQATSGPERSANTEETILKLTDTLRLLETERDEAVKTAESCARTAVKLDEMSRLLDKLALDKVAEGDETGAREVLKEKSAVSEILSRTGNRAQTNFSLAAKLAEKIGQQQAEIMTLLAGQDNAAAAATTTTSSSSRVDRVQRPSTPPTYEQINLSRGYSTSSSSSSSGSWPPPSGSSSSSRYEAPWEKSLAEARARIREAEEEAGAAAAAAGRSGAAWTMRSNKETIDEARDRLRSEAWQSVTAARSRIRQTATESIEQARQRIAAEDAVVLGQVHKLIDRYKAGAYVPEEDLDWAFRQLERRSWRS